MNIIEISNRFPTERDCIRHAEHVRWNGKPKCVYCGGTDLRRDESGGRYRLHCRDCKRSFAVTVNTLLHDTRTPLKTWFMAFSLISDAKKGISAMQLQRNLNISYPTAWQMYVTIRQIMDESNIDYQKHYPLKNIVEMDDTFTGGKPRKFATGKNHPPKKPISIPELDERISELKEQGITFKRGKGNPAKSALYPKRGRGTNRPNIVGIVEREGDVVAEVMGKLGYQNLKKMVEKYVDKNNAVLVTDEAKDYSQMNTIIEHLKINHTKLYSYKGVNTNSIESFWAIIKRQIIGQHHHVSVKHLPEYVAEVVFKYNNRNDDYYMFDILLLEALGTVK